MPTNQTISNSKIIFFVMFVSAALITSLFVYHLSHQTKSNNLSDNAGMVFPVARDIKSFDLLTMNNEKFNQQSFFNHWTLVFFGFTHCSSICPVTLEMLNHAYPQLQQLAPNLQVVFVSLDPERDTLATIKNYTQSFNPAFIGVTGKIQEVRKLQSQLGVYSARDSGTENYQLQHTPSILIINPQGRWVGLVKSGLSAQTFALALTESFQILKQRG